MLLRLSTAALFWLGMSAGAVSWVLLAIAVYSLVMVADALAQTSGIRVSGPCLPAMVEHDAMYAAGYAPDVAFADRDGDRWTVWRHEDGRWRLVLERGGDACPLAIGDRWDAELPLPGAPS